jgi:hypothetical protein
MDEEEKEEEEWGKEQRGSERGARQAPALPSLPFNCASRPCLSCLSCLVEPYPCLVFCSVRPCFAMPFCPYHGRGRGGMGGRGGSGRGGGNKLLRCPLFPLRTGTPLSCLALWNPSFCPALLCLALPCRPVSTMDEEEGRRRKRRRRWNGGRSVDEKEEQGRLLRCPSSL